MTSRLPSLPRRAFLRQFIAALSLVALAGVSQAAVPVAGIAVPELSILDTTMSDFMTTNNIGAGQLSMMRNGVVIYHRSFGWKNTARTQALPLDSVFRIASVSKPITAAAIRKLISNGSLTLNTKVFSLGVAGAGILDHVPSGTPDSRLKNVTVDHLLQHTGGWDRDIVGDIVFKPRTIATALGVSSPPGRDNTVRWAMGQPLQHNPGSTYAYSNFGYMLLGMIIEKVSGQSYRDFVYQNILEPEGVPLNDFIMGRTFKVDQDPREPVYESPWTTTNVFDPSHNTVPWQYGGFDLENFVAFGGTVTNGLTFLRYLNRYTVAGSDIGKPRWAPGNWWWWHSGSLDGTNTAAVELGEGINYAILFNARPDTDPDYVGQMVTSINDIIDNNQIASWPVKGVLPPTLGAASSSNILVTSATLGGSANPEGTATTVWFDWGPTSSYGSSTTAQDLGSGTAKLPATVNLTGLTPAAYHYRLAASNANGTSYGPDQTFSLLIPPSITSDLPASKLLKVGEPLDLSVTAAGSALTYQWRRNTAGIGGQTSSSYSIPSVTTANAASYDCLVANDEASTPSTACVVGVFDPAGGSYSINENSNVIRAVSSAGQGLTFAWYKDGGPLSDIGNYSGTHTSALKITGFKPLNVGTFTCKVTLGAISLYTDGTDYTILEAPKVTEPPATTLAGLGEPLTLSVSATGGGTLSYQWRKNNVVIPGATSATYSVTAATTHAGAYFCTVSNVAGSVNSTSAQVAVVNLAGGALVVNEGGTFSRSITSSVTGLGFTWSKDDSPVSNGGRVSGATSSKLTITSFDSTRIGSYKCHVTFGALSRDTGPLVVTMLAKPVVTPFVLPALLVSSGASFTVAASPSPTKFTIGGLPSGMSYVAATGAVSGAPTTAAASFTLKISATNAAGTGPLYSVTGSIQKLDASLVGVWNGLVPRDASMKINHGGSFNVTSTSTGSVTGKALVDGVSYPLSGRMASLPGGTASLTLPVKRAAALGNLTMTLALDAHDGGKMTGDVSDGTATTSGVEAWRNSWTTATSPATAFAGAYTAAIQVPDGLSVAYPKGTGYALLTLGTKGTAVWSGKFADGAAVTFSTTFGGLGDVPLHQMLYTNKGSAHGWCQVTPDAAAPYAANQLDGSIDWLKDPLTAANVYNYKAGFSLHTRTVVGGKYPKPTAGTPVLGLPVQANNAALDFSEAGVALSQSFTVTAASTASVPANANLVKLALTSSTGVFSGSFVMKDPDPYAPAKTLTRTAKYYGALVPRLSQGVGFFLLPQLPDPVGPPVTTAATAPVLSGKVVLH